MTGLPSEPLLSTECDPPLAIEQREIAEARADAKLLVTAGAGTGKTHTLVARLRVLVQSYGLAPGREVLVLSFSRAAVREIRNRLAAASGDVVYIRAYTFDSFATRMLATLQPTGGWLGLGFDDRIQFAINTTHSDKAAQEYLSKYRCLIVDEIQDLVGVRAELVKVLLERIDGCTLFGDPAQGIYNYQLSGDARRIGSAALFEWIRKRFQGQLIEHSLSYNFRAVTEIARKAFELAGKRLSVPDPDYPGIRSDLDKLVLKLPPLGTMNQAIPIFLRMSGTTAILCRDNGDALIISRRLHEGSVPHRLQRGATERAVAPWVAILLGTVDRLRIGRRQFFERHAACDFGSWSAPSGDEAWNVLKRMDPRRTDDLDVRAVAERIARGDVPDELNFTAQADVVVSTIHRAKGMEFERVVIVEPSEIQDDSNEDDVVLAEETRVLYVALTRPRSELYHMSRPNAWGLRKLQQMDERWIRKGRKDWMVTGFEIRGEDSHRLEPAGAFVVANAKPPDIQKYIRDLVRPGDPLVMKYESTSTSAGPRTFYSIEHNGTVVGVTAEPFGGILLQGLQKFWRRSRFPMRIENLFVDTVDTTAGLDTTGIRAGLGPAGLWLRVRPYGLGTLLFREND